MISVRDVVVGIIPLLLGFAYPLVLFIAHLVSNPTTGALVVKEQANQQWVTQCVKGFTTFWHDEDQRYYNVTHEVALQACKDAWPFRKQ